MSEELHSEQLDYPPAYPNGSLHVGHLLESFVHYAYYNLSDYKTLSKKADPGTKYILDVLEKQKKYKKKDVCLNLGFDNNGLPIALEAKKTLGPDKCTDTKLLFEECKSVIARNTKLMLEKYNYLGLTNLRCVNHYTTDDQKFKQYFDQFYENLKPFLSYTLRPQLYCKNCETFLANAEVSELNTPTKTYYFSVFDAQKTEYTIMTRRPELLPGVVFFAKNPSDMRYKNLDNVYLTINGITNKYPVLESRVVNKDVGSGLVYVSAWGGITDYKIIQDLKINISSSLHDLNGNLSKEPLEKFNLLAWEDVIKDTPTLRVEEESSTIKELYHTERGSCTKPVIYLPSKEVVIKLPEVQRIKLISRIDKLECDPKVKDHLRTLAQNFKQWCISRNINYYSFEKTHLQKTFRSDTWSISCLTPLLGSQVVRYQGSDIINTWALYTLLAEVINKTQNLKRLIVHRMVVDPYGQKFSKSKNNAPDADKLLKKYDLKYLRYYFCEKPLDKDICFNEKELLDVSKYFCKIKNLKLKLCKDLQAFGLSAEDLTITPEEHKKLIEQLISNSFKTTEGSAVSKKDILMLRKVCIFYESRLPNFEFSNILFEIRSWMYDLSKQLAKGDYTQETLKLKHTIFNVLNTILGCFDN